MVKHRESKAAISLQVQDIIIFDYQKAMVPQLNYICPFVLVSIPCFQNYFLTKWSLTSVFNIDNIFKTLLLIFMKYSISNGGTWCAYLVLIVCRGFLYLWISTDCMFKWLHCTVPKPENTNDAECHWNLNHCKDCRLLRYIVLGLPHNCLHFAAQFEHKLDSNSGHVIRVTS